MTPDEHYAAAERLLEQAAGALDPSDVHAFASRAQAHFTAATSAAALAAANTAQAAMRAEEQRAAEWAKQLDAQAQLDDAHHAARRLVHMEREHLGTGRDGHLSERDLAPLLHALHIDPEETP